MSSIFNKYIIDSQFFVSYCGTMLCSAFMLYNNNVDYKFLLFIFFAILFAYNWTTFNYKKSNNLKRVLLIISGILAFCISLFAIKSVEVILGLILLAIPTILYNVRIFGLVLRDVPFLKAFLVAFVWSSTITVLPFLNSGTNHFYSIVWIFLSVYCLILALLISFEIRDLNTDSKKLKTLPQVLGTNKVKILATVLLLISFLFFGSQFQSNCTKMYSFLCTIIGSIIIVILSKQKNSPFFFSFWVNGICCLPLFFYLTFEAFKNWI